MSKIKSFLIYNPFIHKIYNLLGGLVFAIIDIIIPIKENQILFLSFGGSSNEDSPRRVYEELIKLDDFKDYKIIWGLKDIEALGWSNNQTKFVKANTFSYFIEAARSAVWISNVGLGGGLNVKPRKHLYINTWHGTPIKKIGSDISTKNSNISPSRNNIYYTYQTDYEKEIFKRVFAVDEGHMLSYGLPRNDDLFLKKNNTDSILLNLGVGADKEIFLYAPTWRIGEDTKFLDLLSLKESLNDNQILLFRGHHAMKTVYPDNIFDSKIINVSEYKNVTDLLLISDCLITDYSSIFIDYSILNRPIILFVPDYEDYLSERGTYFDMRETFSTNCVQDYHEIASTIKDRTYKDKYDPKTIRIYFKVFGGSGSKSIVDFIKEKRGI